MKKPTRLVWSEVNPQAETTPDALGLIEHISHLVELGLFDVRRRPALGRAGTAVMSSRLSRTSIRIRGDGVPSALQIAIG
jgi:hypothetical protein